jgi:type IV secretion system protein VirB9
MKPALLIAAIAMMFTASPLAANETPHPTAQDSRIREVIYSDGQVFRIVGVFRSATQIVFSANERVEHVALGDTVSWEVAPAENSLFIKPRELAGSTNLIVITRSGAGVRTYTFELTARRGREVLCIFNEAPDFYGRDPKTGTASSIVERTSSQGNGETK